MLNLQLCAEIITNSKKSCTRDEKRFQPDDATPRCVGNHAETIQNKAKQTLQNFIQKRAYICQGQKTSEGKLVHCKNPDWLANNYDCNQHRPARKRIGGSRQSQVRACLSPSSSAQNCFTAAAAAAAATTSTTTTTITIITIITTTSSLKLGWLRGCKTYLINQLLKSLPWLN